MLLEVGAPSVCKFSQSQYHVLIRSLSYRFRRKKKVDVCAILHSRSIPAIKDICARAVADTPTGRIWTLQELHALEDQ